MKTNVMKGIGKKVKTVDLPEKGMNFGDERMPHRPQSIIYAPDRTESRSFCTATMTPDMRQQGEGIYSGG
jgi:hypothetical protein